MLPASASETGVAPNEKSPLPNPGGELADILAKGFADYDPRRDGARTAEMGQADTAVGGHAVKYGYARVSTEDQNPAMQLAALKKAGCAKLFKDEVTGAHVNRPALARCLKILQPGDTLIVWKLDRLGVAACATRLGTPNGWRRRLGMMQSGSTLTSFSPRTCNSTANSATKWIGKRNSQAELSSI
jgi:Resolvase, N terminal domain